MHRPATVKVGQQVGQLSTVPKPVVYDAARPGTAPRMARAPMRDLSDVVFLRREAIADGYTDRAIRALVKAGVWHRVRHGAYVSGALWAELDAADRHRVRARAVLRTAHPSTVLSHVSAAIEHGAPVWGVDLEIVHVTRTDGKPRRREAGVVHHTGVLPDDDLVAGQRRARHDPAASSCRDDDRGVRRVGARLRGRTAPDGRRRRRRGRGAARGGEPVALLASPARWSSGWPTRATSRRASRAPPTSAGRCTCRSPSRRSRSATRTGDVVARLDFAWVGLRGVPRVRRQGEVPAVPPGRRDPRRVPDAREEARGAHLQAHRLDVHPHRLGRAAPAGGAGPPHPRDPRLAPYEPPPEPHPLADLDACWPMHRPGSARHPRCSGDSGRSAAQPSGRFSYAVESTIVVRVETLAAERMRARRSSRSRGVATRILRM